MNHNLISTIKNHNLYKLLSSSNDIELIRRGLKPNPYLEVIANSNVFVTIPIDKFSEHYVDHSLKELSKLVSMQKLNEFLKIESHKSTSIFNRYPLYLYTQVELSGYFDINDYEVSISIQLEELKHSNDFGIIVKFSHEAEIESSTIDETYLSDVDREIEIETMSSGSMSFDKYLSHRRNEDLILKIDASNDDISRIVTLIGDFVDRCVNDLY